MAQRLIILSAVIFACGYGVRQRLIGFNRSYFNVALCGMTVLLLSRLYYLILLLSNGNDMILTVGTLGQASAYLFFTTANLHFLSPDILAKTKTKLCIPGAAGALLLAVLFMVAAFNVGTAGAYIGELIYILCMCSAFYIAVNAAAYRKENTASRAACWFNLCVCLLAGINALSEYLATIALKIDITAISWVLTVAGSAIIAVMLPLLRKGMNTWAQ